MCMNKWSVLFCVCLCLIGTGVHVMAGWPHDRCPFLARRKKKKRKKNGQTMCHWQLGLPDDDDDDNNNLHTHTTRKWHCPSVRTLVFYEPWRLFLTTYTQNWVPNTATTQVQSFHTRTEGKSLSEARHTHTHTHNYKAQWTLAVC